MKQQTHYIFFFILLNVLSSCNKKEYMPDWTVDMSSMPEQQEVISIIGDAILITGLISYSTGINNLLQSDSVIIKPLKEWDYIEKMKPNELIFDTITYAFSTKNGNQLGQLLDYPPKQDISKYPEDDCWSSCKGLKLATTGCTCEYELAHNYKGYQIMLSYYTWHFKEETSSQKLKILVYKKGVLVSEQKISNYNNIIDSQIVYFTSDDAVYFYHFYSDYMGKNKEQVLAKFSFEKFNLNTTAGANLLARARKKSLQSKFYLVNALRLPAKGNKCKFGG